MRDERLMILRMIEEGKITAAQGLALLEALEEEGPWPEGSGPEAAERHDQAAGQDAPGAASEHQASGDQDQPQDLGTARVDGESERSQRSEGAQQDEEATRQAHRSASSEEPGARVWAFRFDPARVGEQVMRAVDQVSERLQDLFESGSAWLNDWLGDSYAFPGGEVGHLAPEEVLDLEIRLPNGRVTVEPSPDERYHLEWVAHVRGADRERAAERARQAVRVEREAGRVILRGNEGWWNVIGRVDAVLRLPAQGRYRLDLMLANASLQVQGVRLERLRARLANGTATLEGVRMGALEVKAANGRIRVEESLADQARLTTANGRVAFVGAARRLRLSTTNGQVRARLAALKDHEAAGLPSTSGLEGLPGGEGVLAETVNGQIQLQLDDELAARALVQLRSLHGTLAADLPELKIWQREQAPGRNRLEAAGPLAGSDPFSVEARSQTGTVQVERWGAGEP
ncbi:MAG TPA: DUF4097 family beta strand repeat-containing protein, partial [Limnochorda sp.]